MYKKNRGLLSVMLMTITLVVGLMLTSVTAQDIDPLPSWSDGPTKSAILQFVKDVTETGGPKYVRPEERIATFDNDGTLWCEQPVVQAVFALDGVKKQADKHPEWREQQPFKAAIEGDKAYLEQDYHKGGKGLMQIIAVTHTGMTQKAFADSVKDFFKSARHPKFNVPYTAVAYQPMVELLDYLRANGFKTYICSGGGIHFMRVISEEAYGIVPENVIGSHGKAAFELRDGKWAIVKKPEIGLINDRAGKPVGIDLHIGRKPILAAGNVRSGGDIAMLAYCQSNKRPSLQLLINHDDAEREFAYREKDNASLNAARKHGWVVVSMKRDWKRMFSFDKE